MNNPNKDIGKFIKSTTSSQPCPSTEAGNSLYFCKEIQLILSKSGTIVIYTYISAIYRFAASIVGLISVMVIIFSDTVI